MSGTQERAPAAAAGTETIEAGNVTNTNLTGNTITTRWAGFYGEVSGGILLGDSANNIFYQWTVSDPTGSYVFAANGTVSDWSSANIKEANVTDMASYLLESAGDNFTNTFTTRQWFNSTSLSINNTWTATTWQNGTQTTNFTTYALKTADNSTMIWAGSVVSNAVAFKNETTDYQILAPADTTAQTYYFYLEFR
ncbi:hypothetical protein D6789_03090 [Candidatus Woesearchaeota archaeon]|nr:MAG: hypothetical protein D6789_03090 [Candidatus Woesearchaeota archaeon]